MPTSPSRARILRSRPLGALALALALTGCSGYRGGESLPRAFTVLAVNDVYRIEGIDGGAQGGLSRLRSLRAELERESPDLLVLHAGDMLYPSLPSRLYDGAQMIDVLNRLDGDAAAFDSRMFATFGNHEFDKDRLEHAAIVRARVEESQFRWLASDIEWVRGDDGESVVAAENLVPSALVESGGIRVGLFSLTTDFKIPAYVAAFRDPEAVARETVARLRAAGAEVVVALTHLRIGEDLALLERLGDAGPDLVIGGHEHERLHEPVGRRWVLKADADAISATVARVTLDRGGAPRVRFEYRGLGPEAPTDPDVDARVGYWLARTDREYCEKIGRAAGCLGDVVGRTRVRLVAEELEIRRFETNLGNWIADRARLAFAGEGVQVAFVNAGGLRLNQDVPPGDVTLEHVEGIFQYPSALVVLRLTGSVLREIVRHSVTDWTGNGKWLQVSGFAFRHDPGTATADRLTLLGPEGPRPIAPDEEILAVTVDFLADPGTGQDGYTMITRDMHVPQSRDPVALRGLVIEELGAAGDEGIGPEVEGRICNTKRSGPCLASPPPTP